MWGQYYWQHMKNDIYMTIQKYRSCVRVCTDRTSTKLTAALTGCTIEVCARGPFGTTAEDKWHKPVYNHKNWQKFKTSKSHSDYKTHGLAKLRPNSLTISWYHTKSRRRFWPIVDCSLQKSSLLWYAIFWYPKNWRRQTITPELVSRLSITEVP